MFDTELYSEHISNNALTCDDRNYDPNKPRIKDILWTHYEWLYELYMHGKVREAVLDNVQKTLLCNTFYLGSDYFVCPECNNFNIINHKCHSRFCTSCGVKYQKTLAAKAQAMCVDVHHRHIVFTIPEDYRCLFRKDRKALNLLFVAARNTITLLFNKKLYQKIIKNKKVYPKDNYYLLRNYKHKIEFGMIASLHTFGRALNWTPHIHCLVPEISYNSSTDTCKQFAFFSFEALRKYWQYEVNRLMSLHFGNAFYAIKNKSFNKYNQGYYVYARCDKQESTKGKSYSKNIGGCVNYMMRYAARPPMAQSRITYYNKKSDEVTWYYDDHKTNERITVNETGRELLKKMIIHIPDTGFRMIRYYGFYNNKEQDVLNRVHELLGQHQKFKRTLAQRKANLQYKLKKLRFRTLCYDTYNRDMLKCRCGHLMDYISSDNPFKGGYRHNDRYYRAVCLDEMREMWLHRKCAYT